MSQKLKIARNSGYLTSKSFENTEGEETRGAVTTPYGFVQVYAQMGIIKDSKSIRFEMIIDGYEYTHFIEGKYPKHKYLITLAGQWAKQQTEAIKGTDVDPEPTLGAYSIYIDLYRTTFILVFGETPEICEIRFEEVWRYHAPEDPWCGRSDRQYLGYEGVAHSEHPNVENISYMSIVVEDKTFQPNFNGETWEDMLGITIAHEANHKAMRICQKAGVTVDLESHEAFNYLSSYIHAKILNCLRHYKNQTK